MPTALAHQVYNSVRDGLVNLDEWPRGVPHITNFGYAVRHVYDSPARHDPRELLDYIDGALLCHGYTPELRARIGMLVG